VKVSAILPRKHATSFYRFAVPPVEAKNFIGFGYRVPSLDIVKFLSMPLADLNCSSVKISTKGIDLLRGEDRHHFVLTLSTGCGLDSDAPEIWSPRLSSP
jgi:hypothetical protein